MSALGTQRSAGCAVTGASQSITWRCSGRTSAPVGGDGRWFVYAELTRGTSAHGGGHVEAWLPILPGQTLTQDRALYRPARQAGTLARDAAGTALLLAVLLAASLRVSRHTAARTSRSGGGTSTGPSNRGQPEIPVSS